MNVKQKQTQVQAKDDQSQTAYNDRTLNVEVLEERVAPGIYLSNRCETVLDVEELEERIAPSLQLSNRCETLAG